MSENTAKKTPADQSRLYHVFKLDAEGNPVFGDGNEHLVETTNQNTAFRIAGVAPYGVKVATTKDAIRLHDAGVKIKRAPPKAAKVNPGADPGGTAGTLPATDTVAAPKAETPKGKKR